MTESRTPSLFQVLHELNKQMAEVSIKRSVKDGNLGLLKKAIHCNIVKESGII